MNLRLQVLALLFLLPIVFSANTCSCNSNKYNSCCHNQGKDHETQVFL